ncbi:MAG: 1-deoxy-D-xylulose-5-phosphate reductoisomerase [Bacteroidales bacterium]|nr:1-deoxy-D-xylulose-5-phosphate reductoisomerase [Bacteroidales bacterium]
MTKSQKIAILGSTGSIGIQTLEVIEQHPDLFEVEVLTANKNANLLIQQALKYEPNAVVIADENKYQEVQDALSKHHIKVFCGSHSIEDIVSMESIDTVVMALVGYSGLRPTYNAMKHNKKVALANKEVLVVGGALIMELINTTKSSIYPIDSEHSAIFQCLVGESFDTIEKLILTASGGPFRTFSLNELENVSPEQALKHPNWSMGAKVSIDSASMMNKGMEVIEAHWLFGIPVDKIEVMVHPESIVHSMVQFTDGSVKAQLGIPDMKLPIQYALSYPQRVYLKEDRLDLFKQGSLHFEKPDLDKFRNLRIAFDAIRMGGIIPCVMNAANEIAVEAFLQKRLKFTQIPIIIEHCIHQVTNISNPELDDYFIMDKETRIKANNLINKTI